MRTEQIIRALDEIECDMRLLEGRLSGIRRALRAEIDPLKQRKDLGFYPEEHPAEAEKVGL